MNPFPVPFEPWMLLYALGFLPAIFMMFAAVTILGNGNNAHLLFDMPLPLRLASLLGFLFWIGILHITVPLYMLISLAMKAYGAPMGASILMFGFGIFGWLSIPLMIFTQPIRVRHPMS